MLRSTGVLPIPIANGDPGRATRRLCGNCWSGSREGEHTRAAAETAQAIKKTVRVPNESSVKHTMFRGTSIIKPQLVFTGNKTSGNFRILLYL